MSRRVVVLLVALGVAIPYGALGAGLWVSRGTGQTPEWVAMGIVKGPIHLDLSIPWCREKSHPHVLVQCLPAHRRRAHHTHRPGR